MRSNVTNLGAGRVEGQQTNLTIYAEAMSIIGVIAVIIIIFVGVISGPAPPVPDDSCSVL